MSSYQRYQSKRRFVLMAIVFLPTMAIIAGIGAIGLYTEVPVSIFTRDLLAIAELPVYAGSVSTVGFMLWASAAALCFLTAFVLHRVRVEPQLRNYMILAGILTLALLVDDAFMIHEHAPSLGISSELVFVFHGIFLAVLLVRHAREILRTDYILLLAALLFLGASVLIDKLHDYKILWDLGIRSYGLMYLMEDGFKLLGIVGWCTYFMWTSYELLTGTMESITNRSVISSRDREELAPAAPARPPVPTASACLRRREQPRQEAKALDNT